MTFHDDPDLERRIRSIAESPQPPVAGSVYRYASEVAEHKGGIQTRRLFSFSSGRRRAATFASLAAAAVLAVALTGVVLSLRGNNTAVKPTPTSSAPSVSPSPVRPSVEPTLDLASAQPSFPTVDPLPPDYVTLGADPSSTWSKVTFTQVTADVHTTPLWSAPRRWSGGWVGSIDMGDRKWLAWTSADGRSWHANSAPGPALAAPTGLVAYDDTGYAWTSAHGNAWTRHPITGLEGVLVYDRVGGSNGILASVKNNADSPPTELAFSTDGMTWRRLGLPVDGGGITITQIAWTGQRFLAIGSMPSGTTSAESQVAAFSSSDGLTWSKSTLEAPAGITLRELITLETGQGGAIMQVFDSAGAYRWLRSVDALTWTEMPASGPLVALKARLYSNGERFVARSWADGQLWSSFDGQTWTALQGKAPEGGQIDYVQFFGVFPSGVSYEFKTTIQYGAAQ
jgi:hypothetical protein